MNDLISRQDAIDAVLKRDAGCGIDSAEVIKDLPSAQQMSDVRKRQTLEYQRGYKDAKRIYEQQWIPCSERLPEIEVLCCDDRGEMFIGYLYTDKLSNTGYSAEKNNCYLIDCIAWMPLPDPWKGESNEQIH